MTLPVNASTLWGLKRRTALRAAAVMTGLSLLIMLAETGPRGMTIGMAAALLPVPIYLALALWLDRFEPEPTRLLVKAFAWGAIVSSFASLIINSVFGAVTGNDFLMTVVSAPLSEEITKGLALILLFRQQRDEFDNVTDGIIYAIMVGLGFAMSENILYYGRALGTDSLSATFIARGVVSPFAHPLFTAMTGIGLGLARERRSSRLHLLYPVIGLIAAILLHSLWNLSASLGLFRIAYVLIMVPAFVAVLRTIRRSLRREAGLIREHLAPYVAAGVIPSQELDLLCDARARTRKDWRALRTGGIGEWRRQRRYHALASDLAFNRWRATRGLQTSRSAFAAEERHYVDRLLSLRGAAAA